MGEVLVTGGAGYIGTAVLDRLDATGHDVRLLDDFSGATPRSLIGAPPFTFVRGDVRDAAAVDRAMAGVDAVVHLAAITGAADSHVIADRVFAVNRGGTETVLAAAERAGVDRVVLASSCNVYGDAAADHLVEADEPAPQNPYAASKLAAERAAAAAPVETVALRLATNFGWSPAIRFNLVVNGFVFRALHGEALTVHGDGTNWRPFLHVRDAARAFVEAIDWPPGVYNVGAENVRINDVAGAVADAVPRPVDVVHQPDRDAGPSYHVDFAEAGAQGFVPAHGLAAGIADLVGRFEGARVVAND